jgi:hypothetical protein
MKMVIGSNPTEGVGDAAGGAAAGGTRLSLVVGSRLGAATLRWKWNGWPGVCTSTGTLVYEQTSVGTGQAREWVAPRAGEEDAASVWGYNGTLRATGQDGATTYPRV